jgi:hypothetical protein
MGMSEMTGRDDGHEVEDEEQAAYAEAREMAVELEEVEEDIALAKQAEQRCEEEKAW